MKQISMKARMVTDETNRDYILAMAKALNYKYWFRMMKYVVEFIDPYGTSANIEEARSINAGRGEMIIGSTRMNPKALSRWQKFKLKHGLTWIQVLLWALENDLVGECPTDWNVATQKCTANAEGTSSTKVDSQGRIWINLGTKASPDWRLSNKNWKSTKGRPKCA